MSPHSSIGPHFILRYRGKKIFIGIGGGLSTTPGIILVSQYFDKHRALANGICVSGTAAGSFMFPLLIELLVKDFGFHGTILLLGGCMLHVCVSATLYRPLDENYAPEEHVLVEKIEKEVKELVILNKFKIFSSIFSQYYAYLPLISTFNIIYLFFNIIYILLRSISILSSCATPF